MAFGTRRLVRAGAVVAATVALLAWPAAFAADALLGRDVWLVRERPEAESSLRRALWEADGSPSADAEVASLYGEAVGRARVLVRDDGSLLRPPEKPGLLLHRTRPGSEPPFQSRTLFFVARWTAAAAAGVGLLLFAGSALLGRGPRPA